MGLNYTIERPDAPNDDEYIAAYISVQLEDPNSLLVNCDLNATPNSGITFEDDFVREAKIYLGDKLDEYIKIDGEGKRPTNDALGVKSIFINASDSIIYRMVMKRFKGVTFFQIHDEGFNFIIERNIFGENTFNTIDICKLAGRIAEYLSNNTRPTIKYVTIHEIPHYSCDVVKLCVSLNGMRSNYTICQEKLADLVKTWDIGGDWLNCFHDRCPTLYRTLRMYSKVDACRAMP